MREQKRGSLRFAGPISPGERAVVFKALAGQKLCANVPECPRCGCSNVQHPTTRKTMPYRCRDDSCRRFFSVLGMGGKTLLYAEFVGAA